MVKKLLKHEFMYYIRILGIGLPIFLLVAGLTRLWREIYFENYLVKIAQYFSVGTFYLACYALIGMTFVLSIVRFYKNLYSSEGYLTFALPVTTAQHLFVKLFVALVCMFAVSLTVVIGYAIVMLDSYGIETIKYMIEGIRLAITQSGLSYGHVIAYCFEGVIAYSLLPIIGLLIYYSCITIGQTWKINRILASYLTFLIFSAAMSIIETTAYLVLVFALVCGALDGVGAFIAQHPIFSCHAGLIFAILFEIGVIVLLWFLNHRIMSKKLNLE